MNWTKPRIDDMVGGSRMDSGCWHGGCRTGRDDRRYVQQLDIESISSGHGSPQHSHIHPSHTFRLLFCFCRKRKEDGIQEKRKEKLTSFWIAREYRSGYSSFVDSGVLLDTLVDEQTRRAVE